MNESDLDGGMSHNGMVEDSAAAPIGMQIPPDLAAAFFTGRPEAIGQALGNHKDLLGSMLRGLPRRALRDVADQIGDVLDADQIDGDAGADVIDAAHVDRVVARAPARSAASPRRRFEDDAVAEDDQDADADADADVDDDADGGTIELMNQLGRGIGNMLAELPGVQLGVTFQAGGRKASVAFFYPATQEGPEEILAQYRVHVGRFGDALDVAYSEAEQIVSSELYEDADNDVDNDEDADGDIDTFPDEPEQEPTRRAPAARAPARRPVPPARLRR